MNFTIEAAYYNPYAALESNSLAIRPTLCENQKIAWDDTSERGKINKYTSISFGRFSEEEVRAGNIPEVIDFIVLDGGHNFHLELITKKAVETILKGKISEIPGLVYMDDAEVQSTFLA